MAHTLYKILLASFVSTQGDSAFWFSFLSLHAFSFSLTRGVISFFNLHSDGARRGNMVRRATFSSLQSSNHTCMNRSGTGVTAFL